MEMRWIVTEERSVGYSKRCFSSIIKLSFELTITWRS